VVWSNTVLVIGDVGAIGGSVATSNVLAFDSTDIPGLPSLDGPV
jgi:hypothetical protein